MVGAARTKESNVQLSGSILRALREGALWVFGFLAVIFFAALVSYHPGDPGFSSVGTAPGILVTVK